MWGQDTTATHADTIRGSITPERAWWDVAYYDLRVRVNPADSTIRGVNHITYRVLQSDSVIQIDLQVPLQIDSFVQQGQRLQYRRDGNAFFVYLVAGQEKSAQQTISAFYSGHPHPAKHAPWDGGFVWASDSLGHTWIATALPRHRRQHLVAHQRHPGRRAGQPAGRHHRTRLSEGCLQRTPAGGHFKRGRHHHLRLVCLPADQQLRHHGECGRLRPHQGRLLRRGRAAHSQLLAPQLSLLDRPAAVRPGEADAALLRGLVRALPVVRRRLSAGRDTASGNGAPECRRLWQSLHERLPRQGSLGHRPGVDWDFIIVHESAHEWWGNSLTTADLADMWVHEGFANYAEGLYVECLRGKEAGAEYNIGNRKGIRNDRPITPAYGLNREGSGDMYPKGGNMLHTIRQVINDDAKWREILRGLAQNFRHQIVTARQVEDYINQKSGINFDKVFQEYLATTMVPTLEYKIEGATLSYHWVNVVPGFDMPLRVKLGTAAAVNGEQRTANGKEKGEGGKKKGQATPASDSEWSVIAPTEDWKTVTMSLQNPADFKVDPNFYVEVSQVGVGAQ